MKKTLLLVLVWTVTMHVYAQEQSDVTENKRYLRTQKKATFAIQPLQVFSNSLRYDFEIRLGNGPGWLQFGPAFYFSQDNNSRNSNYYYEGNDYYYDWYNLRLREPFSKLKGAGLDINYKHFLDARRSFYMAAGLSYTRFEIKYSGRAWEDYTEDGLVYHTYVEGYHTQQIKRFGINNFIGYQIPAQNAFLFDVFGGYAIRFSSSDENKPAFDNYMFSYGYTGFVLIMGIRIGFGIR